MRINSELRAYASLSVANLKMYMRNPLGSLTLVAVLILVLVAVKFVFDGQGPQTRVVVVNASISPQAAVLVKDLRAINTFGVSEVSQATAKSQLDQGKADLEVVIPAEFATLDTTGHPVPVRLMVTYRAASAGESSLPLLKGVVEGYNESVLKEVPTVSLSASPLHTTSTGVVDIFLPGVVAFNIIGSALMLAAGIFTNYKSTGVLRRLKATGIRPSIFVLSHATSSFLVGMVQTAAILVAAEVLFKVHLDILSLFLLMVLGYLVFLALGLAISGWIRDPQRANAVAQSVAYPMIFVALLAAALPPGIASITKYLPVSYVTDGMQQLSQGARFGAIEWDLAWLLGWAIVLLIAAGRVFRWD